MSIMDDLQAAINRVEQAKPIAYYSTSDAVEPGKVLHIIAQSMFPAHSIFNPADFEQQRAELARHVRLVHFREWQPAADEFKLPLVEYQSPDLSFAPEFWKKRRFW